MNEENKIKVNDLPHEQDKPLEEVELPVIQETESNRGGHTEGGCCGACGG